MGLCTYHEAERVRGKRMFEFHPPPLSSAASVVYSTGGTEKEQGDPRLTNCFFTAVARSYLSRAKKLEGSAKETSHEEVNRFILDSLKTCPEVDGTEPVAVKNIEAFEAANDFPCGRRHSGLAIVVIFQNEDGELTPVRQSSRTALESHLEIILLLAYYEQVSPSSPSSSSLTEIKGEKSKLEESTVPKKKFGLGQLVGHYASFEDPEKVFVHRERDSRGSTVHTDCRLRLCYNCFNLLPEGQSYKAHAQWCHSKLGQRIIMPAPGEVCAFKDDDKTDALAYFIAFDFETYGCGQGVRPCSCTERRRMITQGKEEYERQKALHIPLSSMSPLAREWWENVETVSQLVNAGEMTKREADASLKGCPHHNRVINEQKPMAFSAVLINREGDVEESKTYFGEDAAEVFFDTVLDWGEEYIEYLRRGGKAKKEFTEEEIFWRCSMKRQNKEKCHICGGCFAWDPEDPDFINYRRVIDHDHVSGQFVGVAHSICNLHRKEKFRIPVLAHNLTSFDGAYIIQQLGKVR